MDDQPIRKIPIQLNVLNEHKVTVFLSTKVYGSGIHARHSKRLTVNPVKNLARYFSKYTQPCDRDKTVSRCIILWARGSTIAEGGGYKHCDQYSQ